MKQTFEKHIIDHRLYQPGEKPPECLERPPIGLVPKTLHDRMRTFSIIDAMERYASANKPVPVEWVHELISLHPYQR